MALASFVESGRGDATASLSVWVKVLLGFKASLVNVRISWLIENSFLFWIMLP